MNKVLVAKMTWDVVNNSDKMWVMAFKKKYVENRNFMKMPILKGASWASQVSLSAGRLLVRGCAIEMAMALTLGSLKIHGSLMSQGSSPKQEAIFLLMFTW